MYPKISIVIVGGGFAGVACARKCAKVFAHRPDVSVTLINSRPFHEFTPSLYAGASDVRTVHCADHGHAGHAVKKALCLPLAKIFAGTRVQLRYGWVRHVDLQRKTVTIDRHAPLSYSYLALSMGSEVDYCNVPGLAAHAYTLKSVRDALQVRHALEALSSKKGGRVLIGGGGFTGAELAGELGCVMRKRNLAAEIVVIEGSTPLLASLGSRASRAATARLRRLGVRLRGGARIAHVERTEGGITARLTDGTSLSGDILIWTGGVRAAQMYQHLFPLYAGVRGQIGVKSTLQVLEDDKVFVVGDGAYLTTKEYMKGLPPQAPVAIDEGAHAARNIARMIDGKRPIAFSPPSLPYIVPLGGMCALLQYRGRIWQGFAPWLFKQIIELRYYIHILGLWRGACLWAVEERMCMHE